MKKLLPLLLTLTLVACSAQTAFADINVNINNKFVSFDEQTGQPFVDSVNRTQVPFRAAMEGFGATVSWDETTQTGTAEKDGIKIDVPIGQPYIIKDGQQIPTDASALVQNGRTYLPIRAVLEAFGAQVIWNSTSQTVAVTTDYPGIKQMSIHFIDVGQGDSIFIDYGEFEILVDAGLKSSAKTVVDYIKPYLQGNLDVVVATHEHADHIGGLPAVLAAYTVDKIIDNGRAASTKIYGEYIAAVNSEGAEYLTTANNPNITIVMDDMASYRVLQMAGTYDDPNNNSVIGLLSYGEIQTLLMGDAEQSVEKANLIQFPQSEILKAGHHGSSTASGSDFLNVVLPKTVIVSAGTANRYKHPHPAAMGRFASIGANAYGTFRSGSIVILTDGVTYSLNTDILITKSDVGAPPLN